MKMVVVILLCIHLFVACSCSKNSGQSDRIKEMCSSLPFKIYLDNELNFIPSYDGTQKIPVQNPYPVKIKFDKPDFSSRASALAGQLDELMSVEWVMSFQKNDNISKKAALVNNEIAKLGNDSANVFYRTCSTYFEAHWSDCDKKFNQKDKRRECKSQSNDVFMKVVDLYKLERYFLNDVVDYSSFTSQVLNDYVKEWDTHRANVDKVFHGCIAPISNKLNARVFSPQNTAQTIILKDEFYTKKIENAIREFHTSDYYKSIKNDNYAKTYYVMGYHSHLIWTLFPHFLSKCSNLILADREKRPQNYVEPKLAQILSQDNNGTLDLDIINKTY